MQNKCSPELFILGSQFADLNYTVLLTPVLLTAIKLGFFSKTGDSYFPVKSSGEGAEK
jgi:hypothetical protein